MPRVLLQSSLSAILFLAALTSLAGESSLWIFEGLITEADPDLAPELQSGWVLAGGFLYTPIEMTEQAAEANPGAGRLAGGITETEVTVDLYYQLHFSARQATGLAGLDYQDDDPEKDGRDLLGWFIPVHGSLKETGWSSTWLQVWLADSSGKMIRTVPPAISPLGVEWEHGWFRLTLRNGEGQTAYVDGRMEYFGPEAGLEEDASGQWEQAASELGRLLIERDATITRLQGELDESRQRVDGLRRMVDLLVQERSHLQKENALLQAEAEAADPEVEQALNDLTVQKSLLEEQVNDLSARNNALAESLAASELERRQLMDRLEELEVVREPAQAEPQPRVSEVPVYLDGKPAGSASLIEQPVVLETSEPPPVASRPAPSVASVQPSKPVVEQPRERTPPPVPVVNPAEQNEDSGRSPLSRRRGPRKFR